MTTMDDETLRAMVAAAPPGPWRTMRSYAGPWWVGRTGPCGCQRPDCDRGFTVVDDEHGSALAALAPALAAEVLRLRERAERDEAERDEAEREVLHLRSERDEHAHKAGEWEESHGIELARAEMVEAAARAHLAADDALSVARRTDAADVPTAEARALAARECLAGLVGYVGEVAL